MLFLSMLMGSAGCGTYEQTERSAEPLLESTTSQPPSSLPIAGPGNNLLYNGAFSLWQRGTVLTLENEERKALADRWVAHNQIGKGAQVRYSRTEASMPGVRYAAALVVTRNPEVNEGSPHRLMLTQFLEAHEFPAASEKFSVALRVRALGYLNEVTLQWIFRATPDAETTTGAGKRVKIEKERPTLVTLEAEALPTLGLTALAGIALRASGADQGNFWDAGNGFIVEAAMIQAGPPLLPFRPRFATPAEELAGCRRFYEKSYPTECPPGTPGISEGLVESTWRVHPVGHPKSFGTGPISFKVQKYRQPDLTPYSLEGKADYAYDKGYKQEIGVHLNLLSDSVFGIRPRAARFDSYIDHRAYFHWTADAEIY